MTKTFSLLGHTEPQPIEAYVEGAQTLHDIRCSLIDAAKLAALKMATDEAPDAEAPKNA